MPSWRLSRSSASSSRDANNDASLPPRYSNLPPVSEGATFSPSEAESPASFGYHVYHAASRSVTSLGSNITAPTYATYDNADSQSISPSTITVSNPPRYSRLLESGAAIGSGQDKAHNREYTFGIYGGNRLDPWALLHLYDAESPRSRTSKKRKLPRFSNLNKMIGNVELSLNSSQTIKKIELIVSRSSHQACRFRSHSCQLKGTIESGYKSRNSFRYIGTSPTVFLEHTYVVWDRKFGDPRNLARDSSWSSSTKKYDGKMTGNWVFPFSIPFPAYVDLSTLQAVYPEDSEGPVRFIPELLQKESPVSPFHVDGPPQDLPGVSFLDLEPEGANQITPFDIRSRYRPSEKGRPASPYDEERSPSSIPRFSPIPSPLSPVSRSATSPEPYVLDQTTAANPSRPSKEQLSKRQASSLSQDSKGEASVYGSDSPPPSSNDSNALPQSFLERDVMANVHYQLTLSITHGMFSSESR